ncbi:MAG: peptidoglycan editing factor PgeF [Myxococcales bacterium]|nr:peptidoglycan editing factor PgeF [Myxococcales bacterium]
MRLHRSPLLPARHGFSTRLGGVSTGRYATLNVGGKWGDDPANVDENRRLLAEEGGFDPARLATVHQVHGAACLNADGRGAADLARCDADALLASEPGRAIGVYTADCVPILLGDGEGRVAAAHAGWRGTIAGVASAAVEALVAVGARRERIRAALGPSIGVCCFEVGDEVAAQFARFPGAVMREGDGKAHVDLWRANRAILVAAGLAASAIDAHPPCTMCDPERFFSFRRDGAGIGQMLSFVIAG